MDVTSSPQIPEIMRALASELPLNDFGLPTGIYRSDLLPFHLYDPHISKATVGPSESFNPPLLEQSHEVQAADAVQEHSPGQPQDPSEVSVPVDPFALLSGQGDGTPDTIVPKRVTKPAPEKAVAIGEYRIAGFPAVALQGAFVPMQYDEGFPAFEDGTAFWSRLSFEPTDAYMAFERYMMMSFSKPVKVAKEPENQAGTRSLSTLVAQIKPEANDVEILALTQQLKDYYHLYYWGLRARSYDLFRVTQHRQQQEIRALETHDDHYLKARGMRAKLEEYMDDEEDFWDMMTPKTAIDFHKHLTSLERISAGVPASGPMVRDENSGRSFEVEFATVAQAHRGEGAGSGDLINEEGEVLDQALQDPAAVEVLQKLIIRTSGG